MFQASRYIWYDCSKVGAIAQNSRSWQLSQVRNILPLLSNVGGRILVRAVKKKYSIIFWFCLTEVICLLRFDMIENECPFPGSGWSVSIGYWIGNKNISISAVGGNPYMSSNGEVKTSQVWQWNQFFKHFTFYKKDFFGGNELNWRK